MLYKCSTAMQRCVVAVVRPVTDLVEALGYLFTLHPQRAWAVVRAWLSFIAWHRRLAVKRRNVVRKKKVAGVYRFSVVVRYLFGARKFKNMM